MLKSALLIELSLIMLIAVAHGKPRAPDAPSTSANAIFLASKANTMRHLNPLKLLFTVAYVPDRNPQYSVEWNLPLLKTMLLESAFVADDDKVKFISEFSEQLGDYANWSDEKRYQLERFTEKYFNIYKAPDTFLPFADCTALTYALSDEMINDLQPNIEPRKRAEIRARAVARLCESQ